MSAETLRRAAALLRKRVKDYRDAVSIDPQNTGGMHAWWTPSFIETAFQGHPSVELDAPGVRESLAAGAEHLAALHPAVALAVADWLEVTARDVGTSSTSYHAALAFARAYLGEVSR